MAEKAKKRSDKKPKAPAEATGVSEEKFNSLVESVTTLAGVVGDLAQKVNTAPAATAPAVVETPLEKEIKKAGPSRTPVNPDWEEKAGEILGDYLDHCEVDYLSSGGMLFTVVIKKEKSNAGKEYLAAYGSDRRSKEIGHQGIAGVENWCKLIKQNLIRPSNIV